MDQKIRFWCPVDARKMLLIMGMVFALVVTFQHFELPYGIVLPSLSSAHRDTVGGNITSSLSDGNFTQFDGREGLNSSSPSNDDSERSGGHGQEKAGDGSGDGVVSQGIVSLDNSTGTENNVKEFSPEPVIDTKENSTPDHVNSSGNGSIPEEVEHESSQENITLTLENSGNANADEDYQEEEPSRDTNVNSTLDAHNSSVNGLIPEEMEKTFSQENITSTSEHPDAGNVSSMPVLAPNIPITKNVESNIMTPVAPVDPKASSVDGDAKLNIPDGRKSGEFENNVTTWHDGSSATVVPRVEKMHEQPGTPQVNKVPEKPIPGVVTVSDMNNMLLQSWSSPHSKRPRWSSAVDKDLSSARSQIENAPIVKNDPILYAPLYRNVSMFKRSYELMESILKVYIYKEGERPILHTPLLQGIYASEGWFMKLLEANKIFVTKDPRKAHLFYLPFSSRNLEVALYVPNSHTHKNLVKYLKNYLDMIVEKYPFWNRTEGADHFLVACHDWAPSETGHIMANCIRSLCNADAKQDFVFGKDASLPETNVRMPKKPLRDLGGKPSSQRHILAFFAGSMHGYLRPILLQHWENKDPDMKIFGPLPKVRGKNARGKKKVRGVVSYEQYMKSSKYCICAKGYEVNSPRVVEAIFYECVPVIISDNFVPPFLEVLNWESFAVFVLEKDIPNLKNILLAISEKRYREMQMRVKMVQKHFLWHPTPVKYDIFHMILHSIWYNRVFQMQPTWEKKIKKPHV